VSTIIDSGIIVTPPANTIQLGLNASFSGYQPFAGGEWYRDVSASSVDANNANYLTTIGNQNVVMTAFGYLGIPYIIVDSSQGQAFVPVVCEEYASQSDIVWAPIPLRDDIVEGYPNEPVWPSAPSTDDRHVIVFDRATHISYELYAAYRRVDHWVCANMAVWDTDAGDVQRPYGWTSADVAGLSVLIGINHGNDVSAGAMTHAMRFTISQDVTQFASPPGMHSQTYGTGANPLPFGKRMRMKASSGGALTGYAATIAAGWKKYGIINADTGTPMQPIADQLGLQTTYPGNTITQALQALTQNDFEVVVAGSQTLYTEGGSYPTGSSPTASLAINNASGTSGTSVTVTPTFSGATFGMLAPIGNLQRTATAASESPTQSRWYRLQVNNAYGSVTYWQRFRCTSAVTLPSSFDRYISPTGSTSNTGLTSGSPWPISVIGNASYTYALAGATIGLMSGTYDVSALTGDGNVAVPIPSGVSGKPTILCPVSGTVTISGGSNTLPPLGKQYGFASHIYVMGLTVTTSSAPYCMYFYGQNDGELWLYGNTISGASAAGIRIGGGYSPSWTYPLVQANSWTGSGSTYLCTLSDTSGMDFMGNTVSGGASVWNDYGNNSGTVVN